MRTNHFKRLFAKERMSLVSSDSDAEKGVSEEAKKGVEATKKQPIEVVKNPVKKTVCETARGTTLIPYCVVVDGKRITALVPSDKPLEEAKQSIINRFGADRVTRVIC